jgi:hypothetical protein
VWVGELPNANLDKGFFQKGLIQLPKYLGLFYRALHLSRKEERRSTVRNIEHFAHLLLLLCLRSQASRCEVDLAFSAIIKLGFLG